MKDGLSRKIPLSVVLLAVLLFLGFRLFDRPGDRLWRFREMGRAVAGAGRGELSAPHSSFIVFLAHHLGAPVQGLATHAVRALSLLPARGRPARSRMALLLGVAVYWLLFWTYETAMARWSESVAGAIRIDIVVVYPLLFLVTAAGVWLAFDRWSRTPAPA